MDEKFLSDATSMFSEGLEHLEDTLDCCETYANIMTKSTRSQESAVKRCLLGLWRINQDNKWDVM